MCDDNESMISASDEGAGLSRRGLLGVVGALAATGGLAIPVGASAATEVSGSAPRPSSRGLSVTLLGTAGGPPPQPWRYGISSALTVDGKTYVVDCGRGAVSQYMKSGLSMPDLSGIFLTHLHSDHTVDYFTFALLSGGVYGAQGFMRRIGAWGPGPSGGPSALAGSSRPAPGITEMTRLANESHAASTTFFLAEHFGVDPITVLDPHDIVPPVGSRTDPAPAMAPFPVMEDDRIRVTATLVPHGAVWPALAYRFDTEYGSVVFSGDTAPTPNIITLAKDADLLLHEAADFSALPPLGYPSEVIEHIKLVHTDVHQLGAIAKEANVRKLVATHLSPVDPSVVSDAAWAKALRNGGKAAGYRGELAVGSDLMHIPVAQGRVQ